MTLAEAKSLAGKVNPIFPVRGGVVTSGYWEPRPLRLPLEQRRWRHRGWDVIEQGPQGKPLAGGTILAEESGTVSFWCAHRSWSEFYDAGAISGEARWFLNDRFHDAYGNIVLVWGKSGFIYVHCHIEDQDFWPFYSALAEGNPWTRWGKTYDRYVMHTNPWEMWHVRAGEEIGRIGQMGYSTAPHLHLDVFRADETGTRVNPSWLWPGVFAEPDPPGVPAEG